MKGGRRLTGQQTRKEQALKTRQLLLDSARTLFAEKGYSGTPVRSINQRIRMADGLLYHYFPGGKKEILQVMIKESAVLISEELSQIPDDYQSMPLEELLEQLYQHFHHVICKHLDIIKILIKDGEAMKLVEQEELIEILQERKHWLPELFEKRIEQKEIRPMDCECASEILMALMMNHMLAQVISENHGCMDIDEKRTQLIRFLVDMWEYKE